MPPGSLPGTIAANGAMAVETSERRARRLLLVAVASLLGASTLLAVVWASAGSAALGKTAVTLAVLAAALAQTVALARRGRDRDPVVVGRLFLASAALATLVTGWTAVLVWGDVGGLAARLLAVAIAADLVTVALQPLAARLRPAGRAAQIRHVPPRSVGTTCPLCGDPAVGYVSGRSHAAGASVGLVHCRSCGFVSPHGRKAL